MGANINEFRKKRTPRNVFDNISKELANFGFNFSPAELYEKKRKHLDATYCRLKKKKNTTGGNVSWIFFNGMENIDKGEWPKDFFSGHSIEVLGASGELKNFFIVLRFITIVAF